MNLDLYDCTFVGPALPEPFVRFELTAHLAKLGLLATAQERVREQDWIALRRHFGLTGASSGPQRVCNHIVVPLVERLGFDLPVRQGSVATREGMEDGGWLAQAPCGARLRAWTLAAGTDFDAPSRTGRAYRFNPRRSAQRVLLTNGERLGLLTDGEELRLLLCDPARHDSHITIQLGGSTGWRARAFSPDSYRLLLALAIPKGIAALPALLDQARLTQARVTQDLRMQARAALEKFLQAVLDHPVNQVEPDLDQRAGSLWEEGLILIYRLLFILKLEGSADPARAFSYGSTDLWRTALSPNQALGPLVRRHLDHGHDTGCMLEGGLRVVFGAFRDGLVCNELSVAPLGGALFGAGSTPLLDRLAWGEHAVALLLDRLLWTAPKGRARERVHYGALDVEELGRVYEALLELEPGITTAVMSRLRRANLEVVLPAERGARYRRNDGTAAQVRWFEDIPPHRFFLRAGLGRKSTGSFYTPHAFVRFLVRETLAPQIERRSSDSDPHPEAILALKVVDPAAGSGHFLVEACRYLGEALYAACRMCDELAAAEPDAARAAALRRRVEALPDPDGLLLAYLPSRVSEGGASGVSQSRAMAICRRLVAVHCLYGVDSNRLAIELAKLSLWLESYAEGLPLTFLDHRVLHGDSLSGAFFASLAKLPVSGSALDPLLAHTVDERLDDALRAALLEVHTLQATVGADAADVVLKAAANQRLDAALQPLRLLAHAWSGAVMLATREADDEWQALAREVATTGKWPAKLTRPQGAMVAAGSQALSWDLAFPEVFRCDGATGFDAVLSNPPWDMMQPNTAEFLAGYDLSVLDATSRRETRAIETRLLADRAVANAYRNYNDGFVRQRRVVDRLYLHQKLGAHGAIMGGKLDLYRLFAERAMRMTGQRGAIGMVMPSAFHANEGATGIRQLYLEHASLDLCLSFENRRKLFDIHARFKFALVVARRPGPTLAVRCRFYLTEFAQLDQPEGLMEYDRDFISASGGPHATLIELRGIDDLALARQMFGGDRRFGAWAEGLGVVLSRELHMSDDASRFTSVADLARLHRSSMARGYLLLHEGKTIHQFSDRWETPPRYAIAARDLAGKPQTIESAQYYRAACREIARSTDERTAIAAMLPPGVLCGHTISVERRPARRPNGVALTVVAVLNSFAFDWLLRQRAAAHVSLYILAELPVPDLSRDAGGFLAHGCLRLCCNHAGFAPLWREQLGDAWREGASRQDWPVIATELDRWRLRSAMDAIVAHAYRLSREQYHRILGSFSHRSFAAASAQCLAAFDELAGKGITTFCRGHDPYFDIPIVKAIARPVIDLPVAAMRQRSLLGGADGAGRK